MKKIVVILLLILPFVLIYSISFTGKILSEYTHIYVERLALVDEESNEYEEGVTIKLTKGQEYVLNVKVFPELASNQEFTISNSDKSVCEVDEENYVIKGIGYGTSQIVLTSKDKPITFTFYIKVSDDHIKEIAVSKSDVELGVGKTETVDIQILPSTTLQEYRNVVWSSEDTTIATVNSNGTIKGVGVGETWIVVSSDYNEQVFTRIKVTVSSGQVYVVSFNVGGTTLIVEENTLDLKPLTEITVQGYTDLKYKVTTNVANADQTQIAEGVVTFLKKGVYKMEVTLVYEGETYTDTLTVLYR